MMKTTLTLTRRRSVDEESDFQHTIRGYTATGLVVLFLVALAKDGQLTYTPVAYVVSVPAELAVA